MAKPKADGGMVVSLFPFLSILACLIGALVLMIVVLTLSQTQSVDGRTEEEVARAQRYIQLEKQLAQDNATLDKLETLIDESQKAANDLEQTRERNVLLRGNLNISTFDKGEQAKKAAELQQMLEDMADDLKVWAKSKPEMGARIKELEALLAEKQVKPDDTPPPIVVMPNGSGAESGTTYFFAEASGSGVKVLRSFDENLNVIDTIRTGGGSVGVDEDLNTWLDEVAGVPKSQIIVLVRDGGHWSSSQLRNYAMHPDHPYQIPVSRLPLPGGGDADLAAFKEFLGQFPPREKAKKPAGATPPTPEGNTPAQVKGKGEA